MLGGQWVYLFGLKSVCEQRGEMGIDVNHARFLLSAKRRGVRFQRTATLGRQGLHINSEELRVLLSDFGVLPDDAAMAGLDRACGAFAEPFLHFLGAQEIVSIDANTYEGATFIHDMNQEIPADLKGRFDVVIDGGTLEHIFNFPVAIRNCMEMVAVGGHFLGVTPANNFSGHGFYQFSPELFFRVFSGESGFALQRAILCETEPNSTWFEVPDPQQVRRRVEFTNSLPTYLLVQAVKLRDVQIFSRVPQQSFYVNLWSSEELEPTAQEPAQLNRSKDIGQVASRILRVAVEKVEAVLPPIKVVTNRLRVERQKRAFIQKVLRGIDCKYLTPIPRN